MTAQEIAAKLTATARQLQQEGKHEQAAAVALAACDAWALVASLIQVDPSANLQHVTSEQLERRGKAIAKAKAAKVDDALWKAITESRWGSQERYARDRLGISPGSLSAYRSGATPCPKSVAQRIAKDLGVGLEYWTHPRSLTD